MRLLAIVAFASMLAASGEPPPSTSDAVRTIFFDPHGAKIDSKAREVIDIAVQIAAREGARHEIVTGYCDAEEIGSGEYPALAQRRAEATGKALVELGVGRDSIEVRTSEDQFNPRDARLNRRVTIDPI